MRYRLLYGKAELHSTVRYVQIKFLQAIVPYNLKDISIIKCSISFLGMIQYASNSVVL